MASGIWGDQHGRGHHREVEEAAAQLYDLTVVNDVSDCLDVKTVVHADTVRICHISETSLMQCLR